MYLSCFGHLSITAVSRRQKSFVLSKYASNWNALIAICQQLWKYYESCICHHSQLFHWLLRHFLCLLQSQVGQVLQHLWRTVHFRYFFPRLWTDLLDTLSDLKTFPDFVKICITIRPSFVQIFIKALISSIFETGLQTNLTTVVNDWLYWNNYKFKTM